MSTRSIVPFFGRAWFLQITPTKGPNANKPIMISTDNFGHEALRVEFEIVQLAFANYWEAEFIIYNADGTIPDTNVSLYDAVIQEGDDIAFGAGYQADVPLGALPPIIWDGYIFYTTQDRVDVVDKRLIIRCLLNRVIPNFIDGTFPALSTQFTQARFIGENSSSPINVDQNMWEQSTKTVINARGAIQLPRAKTFFGGSGHYLTALADQNNLLSWSDKHGWKTASLQNDSLGPIVGTYLPLAILDGPPRREGKVSYSLIGQPQQTIYGVDFRVLLDPSIQITTPLSQVIVQKQYVRQAPINFPLGKEDYTVPRPLNQYDQYVVVGVKFVGDTRGNPWYTEVTGIANVLDMIQMMGETKAADPNHSG